uniref:hypothetical protein n=1 Tax=Streptomyces polyasparticus TaxID=2767826 RepID=UPI001BE48AE6
TFGTWDGWKNRVLPAAGFATCVVASVGVCAAAGAGIATAKFVGDGMLEGNWDGVAYAKDLAWTAAGSGIAATFSRSVGGARSWGEAYKSSALVRQPSVLVTAPANSTRHAVVQQSTRINWGGTYGNMSVNAGFNTGFCGAGNASLGAYVGAC